MEDALIHRRHFFARERPAIGDELVGDDAGREDVAARIGGVTMQLLRRHVAGRPDRDVARAAGAGKARDAEIQNLQPVVLIDDQVRGLDVPMDDLVGVGIREAEGQIGQQAELLIESPAAPPA